MVTVFLRCTMPIFLDWQRRGGCEFWEWIDPPMCDRATVVIPSLLKKIRRLEQEISIIFRS
ncbi:hypothetical protein G4B88_026740 [Cannabis sativa]|uniref:Uncharacterized protein n=1 Tax=Cannabis sativa TaxID=3483 RepID=A0A7J6F932_CANSA|nr:hypothetical protein G4B88_026740 [Cannabis sativa]